MARKSPQWLSEMIGKKFGRLTVISFHSSINNRRYWTCMCECGETKVAMGKTMINGSTQSCGCLHTEAIRAPKTHGFACGGRIPEYHIWSAMISRCNKMSDKNYAGRGINVCKRWRNSFVNFINDMGLRPSDDHSIERINNDGDYKPSNCRWATQKEQCNNTRRTVFVNYLGQRLSLHQLAEKVGIPYNTIYSRYRRKLTVSRIVNLNSMP